MGISPGEVLWAIYDLVCVSEGVLLLWAVYDLVCESEGVLLLWAIYDLVLASEGVLPSFLLQCLYISYICPTIYDQGEPQNKE